MSVCRKGNRGFTLPEVLLTVAILVILLAVSAVEVIKYMDLLKITELDDAAREIYLAAENRAVLLQNSGASVRLLGAKQTAGTGPATITLSNKIDDDKQKLAELLPAGVIDPALEKGYFYVLYDASSHHVTEVFYAEEELKETKLGDLRKDRSGRLEYYREDKTNHQLVGRYSSDLAAEIATKPLPTPGVEVSIENGNQLILTVKYTVPAELPDGVMENSKPEVWLEYTDTNRKDEDENPLDDKLFTVNLLKSARKEGGTWNADSKTATYTATYTWVLDSLDYKKDDGTMISQQFKGLFTEDDMPQSFGNDFTVTAKLTLSADGYISSSYDAQDSNNSLFAKMPEGGKPTTAYIVNLRHLQNLDNAYSGAANKPAAQQLADIDARDVKNNEGKVLNPKTDPTDSAAYEFKPIANWNLLEYSASRDNADSIPYTISHLKVTQESVSALPVAKYAGLFSDVAWDFKFQNIRLINSTVEGPTSSGGLTGGAGLVTFTKCYLENVKVTCLGTGWVHAGGLAGYWWSAVTFENCDAKNLIVESKGDCAGAMAGGGPTATFKNCTVRNSAVTSKSYAGGLAGFEDGGGTFEKCRVVDTQVTSNGDVAGGLLGSAGTQDKLTYATFTDCSTENVTVSANSYAGGLVGRLVADPAEKDKFIRCEAVSAKVGNPWKTTTDAGGLVGRATGAEFDACTVSVGSAENDRTEVEGMTNIGGMVGYGENIILKNACKTAGVSVKAQEYAGGMVGTSINASLTGCVAESVNVASTTAWGTSGGMVGTAQNNVTLEKCQVYWDKSLLQKDQYVITGANAGGLVGKITHNGTITESFAATLVKGDIYAGGLVGSLSGVGHSVSVTKSYADCYLNTVASAGGEAKDWAAAGGLIGAREQKGIDLTLENVYAAGFITGKGQVAGGLLGSPTEGNIISVKNAYAAMHYNYTFTSWGYICPLGAAISGWQEGKSNCYWLKYSDFPEKYTHYKEDDAKTYKEMSAPEFVTTMNSDTNAFEQKHTGYPFPGLVGLDHYGDWYKGPT